MVIHAARTLQNVTPSKLAELTNISFNSCKTEKIWRAEKGPPAADKVRHARTTSGLKGWLVTGTY